MDKISSVENAIDEFNKTSEHKAIVVNGFSRRLVQAVHNGYMDFSLKTPINYTPIWQQSRKEKRRRG